MRFGWLALSNPVSIWWLFLVCIAASNILLWVMLYRLTRERAFNSISSAFRVELMVLLTAAYVFGCAFRSVLPRADVQRICLFDTWLSSIVVGRSVATVAEICFVVQWAIVLHCLARLAKSRAVRSISIVIVPLIIIAECSSWYAVIRTNYLGNMIENSLWALTFMLIAAGFSLLLSKFRGVVRLAIGSAIVGITAYAVFMFTVDVPMYFGRWLADVANGRQYLGFFAGLHDVSTRWIVTHDIAQWRDEIAWMSLYFSVAVWTSLALGCFGLVRDELPHYLADLSNPNVSPGRLPARVGAG
jgi:hypothetical protein